MSQLNYMEVKITKLTDLSLLQKANSFTTGRDSKMDLAKAYRLGHSPIRTQIFFLEMRDIPLFVASQLVRSHIGVQFFQLTKRTDIGGKDFNQVCRDLAFGIRTEFIGKENKPAKDISGEYCKWADAVDALPEHFDRYAPTDLACIINAEATINMSHKRLCAKASAETRDLWKEVVRKLTICDPYLAPYCVKPCVHCGFCREAKPCGFLQTERFKTMRDDYVKLFS